EGLAHASTFAPTGHSKGWARSVSVGLTAAFEILSIDLEKKRIGVALVDEASARAGAAMSELVSGARLTGKVERYEKFGDGQEAEKLREYSERADVAPPEPFGSLAEQLRDALKPREK
ncbi:MAG TPA: hypothetical protein VGJ29_19090, partial [Vicinamibacterales bacterium]